MLNDFDLYKAIPLGWVWLIPVVFVVILLLFILKGYTLWKSAKKGDMWWFIAIFIFNTFGILELVYILFVLKKYHVNFLSKLKKSN